MKSIKVNPEIRKWILVICEKAYPYGASEELIELTLDNLDYNQSPTEIQGHLTYLEDKGYIEVEELKAPEAGLKRRIAKLTPKGKDLLEGNIPTDPGIAAVA